MSMSLSPVFTETGSYIYGNHDIYHPGLVVLAEADVRSDVSTKVGGTALLNCIVPVEAHRVRCYLQ